MRQTTVPLGQSTVKGGGTEEGVRGMANKSMALGTVPFCCCHAIFWCLAAAGQTHDCLLNRRGEFSLYFWIRFERGSKLSAAGESRDSRGGTFGHNRLCRWPIGFGSATVSQVLWDDGAKIVLNPSYATKARAPPNDRIKFGPIPK